MTLNILILLCFNTFNGSLLYMYTFTSGFATFVFISWEYTVHSLTYIVWIQIFLWLSQTINVLCMAVNMVLSQVLSCLMISCALALIVMFSLVFEAHFGFLAFVSQTFLISVQQS